MDRALGHSETQTGKGKTMVAYFSWSGNTRDVAKRIHKLVGGDLFEIVSVDKYPQDYDECVRKAKRELDASYRPALVSGVGDPRSVELVLVGYPNWWGTIPSPVASFLLKFDSSNIKIAPFCTHGGGGLGRSVEDIAELCPHATILEALAIREGAAESAGARISDWLRRIGQTVTGKP